jgi:hypothetical protein
MVPPTEDETLAEDKTIEGQAGREMTREELIADSHALKAAIQTLSVENDALRIAALPPDEQNKLAASTILLLEENIVRLETALDDSHIENDELRGYPTLPKQSLP